MRYILFDLYGLFYNLKSPQLFAVIAERVGADPEKLRPLFSRTYRPDYDAGLLSAEEYWHLIGADLGIEIDWRDAVSAEIETFAGVKEEMVDFLRELHGAGIAVGLLSNEPLELTRRTRTREWVRLFEPAMFSCEMGRIKPDPAIFELALERIRAVVGEDLRPEDVLFTDDTLRNIEVARDLGFMVHHFDGVDGLRAAVAAAGFTLPTRGGVSLA
ncbi:HAD family phosphatase [Actinomycetaceae bacterium L2_0104]